MKALARLLALLICIGCSTAMAHDSWISRGGYRNPAGEWCCGDADCYAIPKEQIRTRPGGYQIQWKSVVGGKEKNFTEIIPYDEGTPSEDGQYWRCQKPDGSRRCWFVPPSGS